MDFLHDASVTQNKITELLPESLVYFLFSFFDPFIFSRKANL